MDTANESNGVAAAFADPSMTTTHALVAYLRMEADLADEKAKRLRAQAAALAEQFGVTEDMQSQYELTPDQLPPVDQNGVPRYKGKKRGRKPKPRKRKQDPNRRKRQHTAYTLFVQETYPRVKLEHPELQSKEVISIVAKKWKSFSAQEKKSWKERAQATHEDDDDDDEEEDETEVGEAAVGDTAHHHLDSVHHLVGEAEATAAADAVYQQTVAEMEEEAAEQDIGEEEDVDDEIEEEEAEAEGVEEEDQELRQTKSKRQKS